MKYHIITIEREYASGGSEIGTRVGLQLDIPCYGKEVLERAAEKMNTVPERLVQLEETTSNSLLYSLGMANRIALGERDGLSEEGALYVTEESVIREMALQGPCVIVGRCAGWILRDREDVLKRFDRRRANFYRANTCMHWDDKKGYHLVLDSSQLGISACADLICRTAAGEE